jgi:hypothetical protein
LDLAMVAAAKRREMLCVHFLALEETDGWIAGWTILRFSI